MNRPQKSLAAVLLLLPAIAIARAPSEPCHTRSRQMTLIKNCYTGDMAKPVDGSPQFFSHSLPDAKGISYCYNSLVAIEHKTGDAVMHVRVLKDGKDGKFHAYDYAMAPDEIKKAKNYMPMLELTGLRGECFSPIGDKDACSGGLLSAIGLKDTNAPMIVALGKTVKNQFVVAHLSSNANELKAHKPKQLDGVVLEEKSVTEKLMQDIRKKISSVAHAKLAMMHTGNTTPKKLAETSEQFRYCSLAFEGFLKFQKLNDPFTPEEKMTLAALTNYMNNDSANAGASRMPASQTKARPKKAK